MILYLSPIDLSKNEARNAVWHILANDPVSPVLGQHWVNSTTFEAKWYDGTTVQVLGAGGGIAALVEDTDPELAANLRMAGFGLSDSNDNELLSFTETASAVNELTIANAATGGTPTLSATGDDTNIDLNIAAKGTGKVKLNGSNAVSSTGALTNGNVASWNSGGQAVDSGKAVSAIHNQNTDTGTTATSFAVDSGGTGFRLKNSNGEVQLRNLGDSAYADLRVKNLFIEGDTTEIKAETMTVADNKIQLNSNVDSGTPTEDAGVTVRRGASAEAAVNWNETSDYWEADDGVTVRKIARMFATLIGNNSDTTIVVTHDLNTLDVIPVVRYAAGTKALVIVEWRATNANSITFYFTTAPATDEFRVIISG